jgi:flagellar biosynthesis/type III secretory pathway protein FliH
MVVGDKPFDDFKQRIIDVAPEAEATMATIGEQLIQRGRVQGRAEGKAEGKAEGEAKGKADGVLAVLEARGLKLTAEQRSRIAGTKDLTQLDRWLRLAATVSDAEALFSH